MNTVRIESDGTSDLANLYLWLTEHRGQVVELDRDRRVMLGVPITAARAVIVAILLQDDHRPGPQLGGVLRGLSKSAEAEPVRLVFEGRSPAGLSVEESERIATEVLQAISKLVTPIEPIAEVA